MKRSLIAFGLLSSAALLPVAAQAADVFVTNTVNLRAGPGTHYPRVSSLPAGAGLNILGCLAGYDWCDVALNGQRGWVSGSYLRIDHDRRRVPLRQYHDRVNVVQFDVDRYWDEHYRGRSFEAQRGKYRQGPSNSNDDRGNHGQPSKPDKDKGRGHDNRDKNDHRGPR